MFSSVGFNAKREHQWLACEREVSSLDRSQIFIGEVIADINIRRSKYSLN